MTLELEAISRMLIRHDPIRLYFGDVNNLDEYRFEAKRILERLPTCDSEETCLDIVWNVFRAQFGDQISGPRDNYR